MTNLRHPIIQTILPESPSPSPHNLLFPSFLSTSCTLHTKAPSHPSTSSLLLPTSTAPHLPTFGSFHCTRRSCPRSPGGRGRSEDACDRWGRWSAQGWGVPRGSRPGGVHDAIPFGGTVLGVGGPNHNPHAPYPTTSAHTPSPRRRQSHVPVGHDALRRGGFVRSRLMRAWVWNETRRRKSIRSTSSSTHSREDFSGPRAGGVDLAVLLVARFPGGGAWRSLDCGAPSMSGGRRGVRWGEERGVCSTLRGRDAMKNSVKLHALFDAVSSHVAWQYLPLPLHSSMTTGSSFCPSPALLF
jgi:hypothetical protein